MSTNWIQQQELCAKLADAQADLQQLQGNEKTESTKSVADATRRIEDLQEQIDILKEELQGAMDIASSWEDKDEHLDKQIREKQTEIANLQADVKPERSGNIGSIDYDPKKKILRVEDATGQEVFYRNVDADTAVYFKYTEWGNPYDGMSTDQYYEENIIDNYVCDVADAPPAKKQKKQRIDQFDADICNALFMVFCAQEPLTDPTTKGLPTLEFDEVEKLKATIDTSVDPIVKLESKETVYTVFSLECSCTEKIKLENAHFVVRSCKYGLDCRVEGEVNGKTFESVWLNLAE